MALLKDGLPISDPWVSVADDDPVPADGRAIVSLARLRAERDALAAIRPLGVKLPSNEPADAVAPYLDMLSLVAVEFPKFRDGRGFSTARALREHHGFQGEIRAVGHTLPDQYRFLLRCGFTTVEVPDGSDVSAWQTALREIGIAYQRAVGGGTPVSLLRRRLAAEGA